MPRPRLSYAALEARGAFKIKPSSANKKRLQAEKAVIEAKKVAASAALFRNFAAVAEKYARDVVGGAINGCKANIQACQRHLDDLKASANAKYPHYFDVEAANKFCQAAERYPHIKGRWALKNQKLILSDWQVFVLAVAFGWRRKSNHKRRFREMYVCVPRKNGKSSLAAIIGNNMLLIDGEFGAEVYAGATSEKQAWEVFGPARLMLERSRDLMKEYGVEVWAKALVRTDDNSKFWPIIGKPGDGSSPSCAIVDEYHEHTTSDMVDTMVTGMGAREQPMLLIITTAGTNLAAPCYDKHLEAKKVLAGVIENDELFAIIYGIDEGDDWTSPEAIRKANPNLGISIDEDFLVAQQKQAINNPSYQNRFKTRHLDEWCAASVAGINMAAWRVAADPKLSIDHFKGDQAWFALDLASKIDICCFAQVFKRSVNGANHYYAFCRHYLPEDTISEATINQQSYRKWVTTQRLISTEGAEINYDIIRDDVMAYAALFVVQEVVYDPWRATQLAHQIARDGAKVVEMAQSAKNMGEAYDELTSALKGGRFHHDGDPVLEWMASNVVARTVAKGLTLPSKEKRDQKIDGIIAITMAMARAMSVVDSGMGAWLSDPVHVSG